MLGDGGGGDSSDTILYATNTIMLNEKQLSYNRFLLSQDGYYEN